MPPDPPDPPNPPNVLFILSDEHDAGVAGCYGHPAVRTPHLDRLAEAGIVFERAYCASPMCVPSRLSLLAGRYPHQLGAWDNGVVPDPGFRTWGHVLSEAGYETVLCGRTHFNGPDRRHGFRTRLVDDLPAWYDDGERPCPRHPAWRRGSNSHASDCGPTTGDDHPYVRHDAATAAAALAFLERKAAEADAALPGRRSGRRPWLLYCGFMSPHFPLRPPPEDFARYPPETVPLPPAWDEPLAAQHPVIRHLRWSFRNEALLPEPLLRRAIASYWAMVTLLDRRVGRLVAAVDRSALRRETVIVYASDHGELAGQHGIWQKQCFYESAVRVPLILRLPPGHAYGLGGGPVRVGTPVSLVDVLPTLRELAGLAPDADLPGRSLLATARAAGAGGSAAGEGREAEERIVLSEYHSQGMLSAGFMVRRGDWKYCHYVGHRAQLFNTADDPHERRDLAGEAAYAPLLAALEGALRAVCDPEAVDAAAKADQARRAEPRPAGA